MRILEGDEISLRKILITDKIPPQFGLNVQSFHSIITENIACGLNGNHVRVVSEDFEGDGVNIFPLFVPSEIQPYQVIYR